MHHTHIMPLTQFHSDIIIHSSVFYQRPQYTIDFDRSQYQTKECDWKGQHIFTVEQGRRFYLQLNLTAYPLPTRADLYKNGQIVQSTPMGTIFVGVDRMGIQSVDRQAYAGTYTIRSSNDAGYGEISFQLKVQRKE